MVVTGGTAGGGIAAGLWHICHNADQSRLLDEPLNNLDIYCVREFMRTLRQVADTSGRSIIIVLHDLNHAAVHADRIIALRDVRVVADGAPGAVIRRDVLDSVFGFPIRVETIDDKPVSLHFL